MSNATFDNFTGRVGSVVVRFRTVCVCLVRALRSNQLLLHHFLCMLVLCIHVLCAVLHLVPMLLLAMPHNMLVYRLQLRLYRCPQRLDRRPRHPRSPRLRRQSNAD